MAAKSAYEDLRGRTLDKIAWLWAKLSYVAERRSADGTYQHWGFERTHGTEVAQDTFARVHHSLIETILQTRLRLLREDLEQASSAAGISPVFYVSKLKAGQRRLLPSNCPKMTERHLISILKILSLLETRSQSGSQASLQHPPLGRSPRPPGDA
jgi:hypothetical protein